MTVIIITTIVVELLIILYLAALRNKIISLSLHDEFIIFVVLIAVVIIPFILGAIFNTQLSTMQERLVIGLYFISIMFSTLAFRKLHLINDRIQKDIIVDIFAGVVGGFIYVIVFATTHITF